MQNAISITQWAKSSLGNSIALFASHPLDGKELNKPILLVGGVHGDEPEGVWLAEKTLELLREEHALVPWILVPCLNPDGYLKSTRVNGNGVDLNRNYPAESWSPDFEKERYHPGPAPGSESEIQAVVALIRSHRPRLVIHCHSWQPCIVCAGEPGMKDGARLARSSGYKLQADIGYPTPGSLSQFGWHDNGIPIICIEEQAGIEQATIWPRFREGMREIFQDPSPR